MSRKLISLLGSRLPPTQGHSCDVSNRSSSLSNQLPVNEGSPNQARVLASKSITLKRLFASGAGGPVVSAETIRSHLDRMYGDKMRSKEKRHTYTERVTACAEPPTKIIRDRDDVLSWTMNHWCRLLSAPEGKDAEKEFNLVLSVGGFSGTGKSVVLEILTANICEDGRIPSNKFVAALVEAVKGLKDERFVQFMRQSVGVSVSFNDESQVMPNEWVNSKAEFAVRLLWGYFFSRSFDEGVHFHSFRRKMIGMIDPDVGFKAAIECILADLPANYGLRIGVDELYLMGGNWEAEDKEILDLLSGLGDYSGKNRRVVFITSNLRMSEMQLLWQTSSTRRMLQYPLQLLTKETVQDAAIESRKGDLKDWFQNDSGDGSSSVELLPEARFVLQDSLGHPRLLQQTIDDLGRFRYSYNASNPTYYNLMEEVKDGYTAHFISGARSSAAAFTHMFIHESKHRMGDASDLAWRIMAERGHILYYPHSEEPRNYEDAVLSRRIPAAFFHKMKGTYILLHSERIAEAASNFLQADELIRCEAQIDDEHATSDDFAEQMAHFLRIQMLLPGLHLEACGLAMEEGKERVAKYPGEEVSRIFGTAMERWTELQVELKARMEQPYSMRELLLLGSNSVELSESKTNETSNIIICSSRNESNAANKNLKFELGNNYMVTKVGIHEMSRLSECLEKNDAQGLVELLHEIGRNYKPDSGCILLFPSFYPGIDAIVIHKLPPDIRWGKVSSPPPLCFDAVQFKSSKSGRRAESLQDVIGPTIEKSVAYLKWVPKALEEKRLRFVFLTGLPVGDFNLSDVESWWTQEETREEKMFDKVTPRLAAEFRALPWCSGFVEAMDGKVPKEWIKRVDANEDNAAKFKTEQVMEFVESNADAKEWIKDNLWPKLVVQTDSNIKAELDKHASWIQESLIAVPGEALAELSPLMLDRPQFWKREQKRV